MANHEQFGNNFYMIFFGLRPQYDKDYNASNLELAYLEKAQRVIGWEDFKKNNKDLILQIIKTLQGLDDYYNLLNDYLNGLGKSVRDNSLPEFLKEHEEEKFGIDHMATSGWNILNPLLEKADRILRENYHIGTSHLFI